ncbi:hypothetical protein A3F37_03090 [Candidatus Saccharibacteria bacterium RIFCSPHIGHO2_12_FULL_41_12]|nr:MAG: hypothetical protein A3F37_03090 [Candidatus Saccharibacteria bacterium RIFCSPHIGHO2_12_FULL_41_12]
MTLPRESEESLLIRSIALDLEQYLLNTLRAHELSQKTGNIDPRIEDFTKRGLALIDTYMLHKSYQQGQLALISEPMNLGAVLALVDYEISQFAISPQIKVLIDKKQPLVASDFRVVKEIVKSLALFIAAFEGNQSTNKKITMEAYQSKGKAKVGVFSDVSLSAENFNVEKLIKSKAKMPLAVQSSSALPEYYLAELFSQLLGSQLALTKRNKLYGFSLSLEASQQLTLI